MYADWYKRISGPFRNSPNSAAILNWLDKGLVAVIATGYIAMLIRLLSLLVTTGDTRFVKALLVPATSFAVATIIRKAINAPRPYEAFDIDPLIKKSTRGESFPSRHLFSAAIIACTLFWINEACGVVAFIACGVVGFCRIVGGVHFPRDIIGAIAFAIAFALIGFVLIP